MVKRPKPRFRPPADTRELVISASKVPLQRHDRLDTSGCRFKSIDQSIVKLSRKRGIAAETACEDDEPETGELD